MTIYLILRALVILTLIRQVFLGNWNNVFLCGFTLILFLVPVIIDKKFNIQLPDALQVIILLFIYSAEILGEINEYYIVIKHWDTMLHTLNGFLCAAVGFSLINLLNKTSDSFNLSPMYLCLVAFCFSMTIGVLWEFFEYSADQILLTDMQKDRIIPQISTVELDKTRSNNAIVVKDIDKTVMYDKDGKLLAVIEGGYLDIGITDTMKDLFVNFIGAAVFSVIGFIYLKTNRNDKFISNFVPTKGKRPIPDKVVKKLNELKEEEK